MISRKIRWQILSIVALKTMKWKTHLKKLRIVATAPTVLKKKRIWTRLSTSFLYKIPSKKIRSVPFSKLLFGPSLTLIHEHCARKRFHHFRLKSPLPPESVYYPYQPSSERLFSLVSWSIWRHHPSNLSVSACSSFWNQYPSLRQAPGCVGSDGVLVDVSSQGSGGGREEGSRAGSLLSP